MTLLGLGENSDLNFKIINVILQSWKVDRQQAACLKSKYRKRHNTKRCLAALYAVNRVHLDRSNVCFPHFALAPVRWQLASLSRRLLSVLLSSLKQNKQATLKWLKRSGKFPKDIERHCWWGVPRPVATSIFERCSANGSIAAMYKVPSGYLT